MGKYCWDCDGLEHECICEKENSEKEIAKTSFVEQIKNLMYWIYILNYYQY